MADKVPENPVKKKSTAREYVEAIGIALDLLAPHGRFTTYTAASDVRRSLPAHGAHVARVRGPAPRPEHIVAAREARLLPQENVRRYDAPSPTPPCP